MDSTNLIRLVQQVKPDESYILDAQSHVAVCFEAPEYTANSDAFCILRILEAISMLGVTAKTSIYQASMIETEETPKKQMNMSRLAALGWQTWIPLTEGLSSTVKLFRQQLSQNLNKNLRRI